MSTESRRLFPASPEESEAQAVKLEPVANDSEANLVVVDLSSDVSPLPELDNAMVESPGPDNEPSDQEVRLLFCFVFCF